MKNCSNIPTENFKNLLWKCGFTDTSTKGNEDIAKYLCVSPRTIRRWIKTNKPSKQAVKILNDRERMLNNYWENFRILNDKIMTPNGYRYSAQELKTLCIEIERIKSQIRYE
ncbi:DUF3653 domain-containing protein [Thalassotalea ganghwensis]